MLSRSHFLEVLINRIRSLERAPDYKALDKLPLLNRKGEPHPIPESLFLTRSFIRGKKGFGEVIPFDGMDGKFFFYGFDINVVKMLLSQDFERITHTRYDQGEYAGIRVRARIPKRLLGQTPREPQREEEDGQEGRLSTRMKGDLVRTPSGRILGYVAPIE